MLNVNPVNEALTLAEAGFRVFPVNADQKTPRLANWQNIASSNEDQICEWYGGMYGYGLNIGVLTEDLVVVDVDQIKVKDSCGNPISIKPNEWEHLPKLLDEGAPMSLTPTGSRHVVFRQRPGMNIRNSAGKIAPGIDIRANGGYIVGVGSVIGGKMYQWVISPDDVEIPYVPDWLVKLINELRKTSDVNSVGTSGGECYIAPEVIKQQTTDDQLAKIAGGVRRYGLDRDEILAVLTVSNKKRAAGRHTPKELERIADSMSKYEPDQAAEMAILGMPDEPDEEALVALFDVSDPGPIPSQLLTVPGVVGEIIDFNLRTAHRQQPELALGAAMALMAAVISGRVMEESGMRPNLYVLGTAPTGAGKDHARQVNKKILAAANWKDLLGPEDIASHSGLINHVAAQRCSLWQIDEIGKFLGIIAKKDAAAYHAAIPTILLKMFSSSNGSYITPAYADVTVSKEIEEPHLNLYGTTVGDSVMQALSQEAVRDGLLSRFLIFDSSHDFPSMQHPVATPVPLSVVQQIELWRNYSPGGNLCQTTHTTQFSPVTQPRVVPYDQAGRAYLLKIEVAVDVEIRKRESGWELYTRVIEKTKKLALIYACSRDFTDPFMDEAAVKWAFELVMHLTQKLRYLVSTRLASSQHEADCLEALRLLKDKRKGEATETEFNADLRKFERKKREDIKSSLQSGFGVICETRQTKGRSAKVWRIAKSGGNADLSAECS